ncbi:GyrI-like domain-containing protein [Prolixibacteraceae bacterium Z1-6]|uniref:GyrI-like domain-containing protein n=1 Tax=Draconibacterium aestuarii TaxID=2998507 RepID=A0A9X3J7X9_9BACT|nr:GyrI-like domain-containing protein [Prolixibacteraceae bacterium Z1-6]
MRKLIRINIAVLIMAALFVGIAYLLPQTVHVERTAVIEALPKTVYSQIIDLKSWNKWSVWYQMDPEMEITYSNYGVGVGAGYTWDSENKKVGTGSVKITDAVAFRSITVSLNFMKDSNATSTFLLSEVDGSIQITWFFKYNTGKNPIARWMGVFMDNFVGPDFEKGLQNLNALCKGLETNKAYIVLLDDVEEFAFASIREKVQYIDISLKMEEMYEKIGNYLAQKEIEMAGMPYSLYHLMDEDGIDLECGIPTTSLLDGNDEIETGTFRKTRCAILDFYGDYQNLSDGHSAVQKWIENHGFTLAAPPIEIYESDPGTEPNSEKWLTRICYPVE